MRFSLPLWSKFDRLSSLPGDMIKKEEIHRLIKEV
jgi:hypothetical protein